MNLVGEPPLPGHTYPSRNISRLCVHGDHIITYYVISMAESCLSMVPFATEHNATLVSARVFLGATSIFVTFHGIYMFPAGITLSLVSVMHLWATLGCGVFSCHSNLVNHVRVSMSAPSMKSVAHRPLCA